MKLIDEKELAQLLLDRAELDALEAGGVDNWNGFGYSVYECREGEYFQELKTKSIKEITKEYKDA